MGLPVIQLKHDTYTFPDGNVVDFRELSRAEALQIRMAIPNVLEVETLAIAFATGVSKEEAEAWHKATGATVVDDLVKAITKLSGLDEDTGKADAVASPSAKSTE